MACTWFPWLRLGTRNRLLCRGWWTFRFSRIQEFLY
jgi:hypothetical protein